MKLLAPYHQEKTTIFAESEPVEVKAYQIIVWVSVSLREVVAWDDQIPKFPAILDTGHTHNFAISQEQLQKWAGIHPDRLRLMKRVREKTHLVPLRAASLWLHGDQPLRMNIDEGIGVYEQGGPRLPILGLRSLTNSKLQTLIYGDRREAIIRTPPKWYWPF